MNQHYDIVIIGSGMSGLYSAYKIKKMAPSASFIILEKYKKQWLGGRTSNDTFYGSEIVTGAGIGRKGKDILLYDLLRKFRLPTHDFPVDPTIAYHNPVDIRATVAHLKTEYNKYKKYKNTPLTFKEFAQPVLGASAYKDFIISAGYSDYENEDVFETLFYYGIEDNACCWTAFHVPWKQLVMKLFEHIGEHCFKFSNKVVSIEGSESQSQSQSLYTVHTEKGVRYSCNKVIVATTIDGVRSFFPQHPIYKDIEGQPFLRLYAKFAKASIPVLRESVRGFTFVPGPLQRIVPINADTGVYMIAYNDNKQTLSLKDYLKNTPENRELYQTLLEKTLGLHVGSLRILALKDFYWKIGTHYYKPLNRRLYSSREEFMKQAQHPEKGILVVGEAVSRNQGWTEGALESVEAAVTKQWILA
jgi:hypothetical protein